MKTPLDLLLRCRELREQAAQRAQAHAAHHARVAHADEAERRAAAAREAARQMAEQGEMMHRLLRQEVLPQVLGGLLEGHGQKRERHAERIEQATRLCRHMDQHLDYARRACVQRSRALERAGELVADGAARAGVACEHALEAADDDFTTTWVHRRRAGAAA